MADTNFIAGQQIPLAWIQDVNNAVYRGLGVSGVVPTTLAQTLANIGAAAQQGSTSVQFSVAAATGANQATPLSQVQTLIAAAIPTSGVISFNARTGAITLTSADVTTALGYIPANSASGVTSFNTRTGAVSLTSLDVTSALGFTPASSTGAAINVKTKGATGNGTTNDTGAFTSALTAAQSTGVNCVIVPPGTYLLDPFSIPAGVTLQGLARSLPSPDVTLSEVPTLLVNSGGSTFITLGTGASVVGLSFYYPGQTAPTGTTPVAFPSTVTMAADCAVDSCTFINAYDAISVPIGRAKVNNCNIGALRYGLVIDGPADWVTVTNTYHQVFWDTHAGLAWPQAIDSWVMANSAALFVGRCDSLMVDTMGVFAREQGMNFHDGSTGNAYGRLSNIDLDTVAYGIVAQSTNTSATGIKITNMDVGANGSGIGTGAQTAIYAEAGGAQAPHVLWIGGSTRGTWAAGFTVVSAGKVVTTQIWGADLTP